ncbi:MAG: hypothetical protein ACK4NF_00305 [Planctomycetota bacterium]
MNKVSLFSLFFCIFYGIVYITSTPVFLFAPIESKIYFLKSPSPIVMHWYGYFLSSLLLSVVSTYIITVTTRIKLPFAILEFLSIVLVICLAVLIVLVEYNKLLR